MGRSGAAAAADHLHTQILHEVHHLHAHFGGRQPVVGDAADVFWQAGIRNAAHHEWTMGTEIAHMLLHLFRPSRTVKAEDIHRERFKNRHDRGNIRTHQHRAGGFHRDRNHQRPPLTAGAESLFNPLEGGLDLEHVLASFNNEQIHIPRQQALGLLAKGGLHGVEINMTKGRQLGGGSNRSSHETRFGWRAVEIGHLPGEFSGPFVKGEGLGFQSVFGQYDRSGPEGIGFDHVGTHLQELAVHRLHGIGTGDHQVFVTTLQGSATEILGAEVHLLKGSTGGPIEDQHGPRRVVESLEESDAAGGRGSGNHQASMRIRVTQCS